MYLVHFLPSRTGMILYGGSGSTKITKGARVSSHSNSCSCLGPISQHLAANTLVYLSYRKKHFPIRIQNMFGIGLHKWLHNFLLAPYFQVLWWCRRFTCLPFDSCIFSSHAQHQSETTVSDFLTCVSIFLRETSEWNAEWLRNEGVRKNLVYWEGRLTGRVGWLACSKRESISVKIYSSRSRRPWTHSSLTRNTWLRKRSESSRLLCIVPHSLDRCCYHSPSEYNS